MRHFLLRAPLPISLLPRRVRELAVAGPLIPRTGIAQ